MIDRVLGYNAWLKDFFATWERLQRRVLVEGVLIAELKAVKALANEPEAQIMGCLKSARLEHGLLINFLCALCALCG